MQRRGSPGITRHTEAEYTRLCGRIVYSQCSREQIKMSNCRGAYILNLQEEGFSQMGAERKI